MLRVVERRPVVVIALSGVVDFANVAPLRAVLSALLDSAATGDPGWLSEIIVDVADVGLLDAAGLGALVAARQRGERIPVSVGVRGATGRVLRVMEIAGDAKNLMIDSDDEPPVEDVSGEDWTVEWLLRARAGTPDEAVRTRLRDAAIEHGQGLAGSLARRYCGRGEPLEDLQQVALLGLIKAVDGYDPTRTNPFGGYAVPTIVGELKRYFRDRSWRIRVPRRLQELRIELADAGNVLSQRFGRSPTIEELAVHTGTTDEQVLEAMEADRLYRPTSLSSPMVEDGSELGEWIGAPDDGFDRVEYREAIRPLLAALPPRQQRIVAMRFYGNLTQSQIAATLGISQMHVSRLLNRSLNRLRSGLLAE